jgi:hypothetical protein
MILKWIEYLRKHLKTLTAILIVYLAVLVLFDVILSRHDAHYIIDKVRAFWTLFGIVGCFLLIKVAKGIAHMFLSKDEGFYE